MAIDPARVGLILLAAGRATRFGADKLAQSLDSRPVAHHAAATLAAIGIRRMVAVTGANDLGLAQFGFELRRAAPDAPMSASIVAGVVALEEEDVDACLVALADMPLVPEAHFRALLAAHAEGFTATGFDGRMSVPAVFARDTFPSLRALTGDRGASSLLQGARHVVADPAWMTDIDTPDDLARIRLSDVPTSNDQA